MKVVVINDPNAERAKAQLKSNLGISDEQFRLIGSENRQCTFEVIHCPASIEVEISRDAMNAFLTRLRLPVGDKAPKLTPDYLIQLLAEKGVRAGILHGVLATEIKRILSTPGYDDDQRFRVLIAQGLAPISGKAGRSKLLIDPKLFDSAKFVMARKGEILAKAPNSSPGQDGYRVTGEKIPALMEEQAKLTIGAGIEIENKGNEFHYVIKETGRLFYDQGIRWRLEVKAVPLKEGLDAGFEILPKSFSGARISAKDLLAMAPSAGITHGLLSEAAIESQIKSVKKWPAVITVAKGTESVDGKPGDVVQLYKSRKADTPLDQERVKAQIVFPGEEIMLIKGASAPQEGKTAFGESIRGHTYDELPIYPGRGIAKERRAEDLVYKATTYGRVSVDKDRVNILNLLEISKDLMEATIDLFPQVEIPAATVVDMLREQDVLFGYDKESLEIKLKRAHAAGKRVEKFLVARGRLPHRGRDAKVDFKFNPDEANPKTGFLAKAARSYFALPGDLLAVKYLPVEAQEGMNLMRERKEIEKAELPKDIVIEESDTVDVVELGREDSEDDPLRLEYRAAIIGNLIWNSRKIEIRSTFSVSKDESQCTIKIAARSDFGSTITQQTIQKIADEEGIKVDLNWPEINKAIATSRANNGEVIEVVLARAVEPTHGADSRIQYFVEFNGQPIEDFLGKRSAQDPKAELLDCVRPGDALAVKTPAGAGSDGKTVFGRRIPADRGRDDPFLYGHGIEKSKDGTQIYCNLSSPGYVLVEQGRMVIRSLVQPAKDKMSATISLYPSRSSRFSIREDKVIGMVQGAGIKFGIKTRAIMEAVEEVLENKKPILNLKIAEGRKPEKGKDASFRYVLDIGGQVGTMREDGSIDFKNKNMFQSVKAGQVLLIKQPPSKGESGSDIYGNQLPGTLGKDGSMQAGSGVALDSVGLEYKADIDGIVEVSPKSIRVIPGLLVNSDVGPKTGNIDGGTVRVVVRGAILPDFEVKSENDVLVEKAAEGCVIRSGGKVSVRGGIIGLKKALVVSKGDLDTPYITSEAQVEVRGNLRVGAEVMHSRVICQGDIFCTDGAGAIVGGEIIAYKTLRCKTLGTLGAETPTVVILGEDRLGLREAEREMEQSGLAASISTLQSDLKSLAQELRTLYEAVLAAGRESAERAAQLNIEYRNLYERHKAKLAEANSLDAQKQAILDRYPYNSSFVLIVKDTIHPGTVLRFKEVQWSIKDPLRSVEIRWNVATANFTSRRI